MHSACSQLSFSLSLSLSLSYIYISLCNVCVCVCVTCVCVCVFGYESSELSVYESQKKKNCFRTTNGICAWNGIRGVRICNQFVRN